jgi:hypothetical protein
MADVPHPREGRPLPPDPADPALYVGESPDPIGLWTGPPRDQLAQLAEQLGELRTVGRELAKQFVGASQPAERTAEIPVPVRVADQFDDGPAMPAPAALRDAVEDLESVMAMGLGTDSISTVLAAVKAQGAALADVSALCRAVEQRGRKVVTVASVRAAATP